MDRVRKLTGAEPLLTKGFTGKGITAAVLDSGIYPHPDLKERIVAFRDFVNGRKWHTFPWTLPGHRPGLPSSACQGSGPQRKREPPGCPPGHRICHCDK